MKKFKVGDTVLIVGPKDGKKIEKYPNDIKKGGCRFASAMEKYIGKEAKITEVKRYGYSYHLDIDNVRVRWFWFHTWLESSDFLNEEEFKIEYI